MKKIAKIIEKYHLGYLGYIIIVVILFALSNIPTAPQRQLQILFL